MWSVVKSVHSVSVFKVDFIPVLSDFLVEVSVMKSGGLDLSFRQLVYCFASPWSLVYLMKEESYLHDGKLVLAPSRAWRVPEVLNTDALKFKGFDNK